MTPLLKWVEFPFFRGSSNPGIEPRSSELQADSLPAEPQEKPKSVGVGGLSLLQGIFLTQELNWDLLHCWQILYQLSYQVSPSPPNSQTPGFPNKVAIPCLNNSSLTLLACALSAVQASAGNNSIILLYFLHSTHHYVEVFEYLFILCGFSVKYKL